MKRIAWVAVVLAFVVPTSMATLVSCVELPQEPYRYVDQILYQWEPKAGICFAVWTNHRTVSVSAVKDSACKAEQQVEREDDPGRVTVMPVFRAERPR